MITTGAKEAPADPTVWQVLESPGQAAVQAAPDCNLLDDPDALVAISGAYEMALRLACGRWKEGPAMPLKGPAPAVPPPTGVDARVNAIDPPTGSTIQSETSLAVNEDTGVICATYNDAYHWGLGDGIAGFARSTDGGATWQDGGPFPRNNGEFSWGDPSVVWRRVDGLFYFTSMVGTSQERLGLGLWRSDDDCATFTWAGYYHYSNDDKEFMAVDNNPGSPYYARLYVAWTDLASPRRIAFIYSDDGVTWSTPRTLSIPGEHCIGAWPAIAPNGDVYVVWLKWVIYDTTIRIDGVRSVDGGETFSAITSPLPDTEAPRDLQSSVNCGRPALKANPGDGIRYYVLPEIAVGPDGCLHVVYSYDPDGFNVGDVVNVYYRRSCDHGATWEPEVQLNDDGGLTDQFFPAITVNKDNLVAASWYDRRLDPVSNYLFDRYWTISYNGGTTWEPNARVSDVSSPVYTSSCYHGDYDQMATQGNTIYYIWSDDRIYFNGHYDPDIWFDQATIPSDFTLLVEPKAHSTCRPATVASTITVSSIAGYNQPVTLSDSDLPAGVGTTLDPNPVTPLPGQATYTITVTESAADGTYDWLVTGTGTTLTHNVTMTLVVSGTTPTTPTLTSPSDGAMDVPHQDIPFGWMASPGAASYRLQMDDDPAFASPEADVSGIPTNSYTLPGPLAYGTAYYWRVQAANGCGTGPFSTPFSFTTEAACQPVADADFIWEPLTPTVGAIMTFTAEATGTQPITFTWDLGDGAQPGGVVVTHTYTHSNTYTVLLTATNPCGEDVMKGQISVMEVPIHRLYLPVVLRGSP